MVEILISTSFRWLFRCSIVVDGNFHADHLKMRHPKDDVTLADGLAFNGRDQTLPEAHF